ncbi:MAG TPA: phosphate/phosphite/phosphonate ABC transporter substrate-binding protein [Elusimicrobia bacterium]|nr:MAG: hypothetical protein A2278_04380 [Elusimicrobia bacterium RIFOXYA12_FULL_49_49]OGS08382.1 MAG: hypothetical protein A2204_03520 [Elusimicrobia bacterium RIFOXYA1_FULL_47_7]OGS10490.1 MAG: hypothetical protein A2386_05290 [Elusimicrobia bacterium RIFOXYB1_FULL_48_9]OGS14713.1 MAG: hypothetical protein A2251_09460 [Elusimicrobia bacterium RIFOXYA2_FULL_47_53]OGS25635.1 MAG: hypothetical protein A2339_06130 [Elusimicrobia bacterium RIFOXYB12_FULL_50_12]OGS31804.1 MAG: hypothetical protein
MARKTFLNLFCFSLAVFLFYGCGEREVNKISFEKREKTDVIKKPDNGKEPITVAVGGMITPKEGYIFYRDFVDFVGKMAGRPIKYIDAGTYEELNSKLKHRKVDLAFVCAGPYVEGHSDFGLELLAAPQVKGKSVYYAYIIVPKNSHARSLRALRGKKFAFTDPSSNTGKIVPEYMLRQMKETPESFFGKVIYTYGHDKSIEAVADGLVDGASVDSLIWEYMDKKSKGEISAKTRIVEKSQPYGIPPLVVRKGIDPELKAKIKGIFLNAHNYPECEKLLEGMMIEKFIDIDDSAYDSVRDIKKFIEKNKK